MARLLVNSSFAWTLMFVVAIGLVSGCSDEQPISSATSQFKPADVSAQAKPDESTTAGAVPDEGAAPVGQKPAGNMKQPAPIAVDKLDAESMPDGPPAALLAYMQQMDGYKPHGVTRDQQRADLVRVMKLVTEAADRLLVHPDATDTERREGATLKMSALTQLTQMGEPKADQELLAFAARLAKDKSPEVAKLGRMVVFSMNIAKLQAGDIDDPQQVIAELKQLLETEDEEHVIFELGKQTGIVLIQLGKSQEAADVLRMIGTKYQDDKSEKTAAEAKSLLKQVKLVELELPKKLNALFTPKENPTAANDLLEVVKTLLLQPQLDISDMNMVAVAAMRLEQTGNSATAAEMLDLMEATFKDSTDPTVKSQLEETLRSGRQRLALLGKPLQLSGNTLDGQPLDVAALRGKIVLVDFWATWCDPCLAEIPNIKKYYAIYKDKGFEVIGYNLDEKREDVERFFANQKLPWQTVVSQDDQRVGFQSPLAELCGVQSIPFLMLLDGEGKVIALHVRGERLGEKLAELLGPVEQQGLRLVPRTR